jgi:hypothetical protein
LLGVAMSDAAYGTVLITFLAGESTNKVGEKFEPCTNKEYEKHKRRQNTFQMPTHDATKTDFQNTSCRKRITPKSHIFIITDR